MEFAPVGAGIAVINGNASGNGPMIDAYPDGVGTSNGNYTNPTFNAGVGILGTADMTFFMIISPATPSISSTPIPTMSQWGLLIFGLLIMNLSVFYVQRSELI